MDAFLGSLTKQAVNYAVRTGFTITANYVYQQSTKLIKNVDGNERVNLLSLRQQLDDQMKVISPAIDMIELISARGNTSLESAKGLTKSIRLQIQSLGQRIAQAVIEEEQAAKTSAAEREVANLEVKQIVADIKNLLARIKDAIPSINLAIATSGVNLSGTLPTTVSPSRLLQASTFLSTGDSQYNRLGLQSVQIGPTFTTSLYMLFTGHARPNSEEDVRNTIWKEVLHKARLKLMRVPREDLYNLPNQKDHNANNHSFASRSSGNEFAYQIVIVEDLDDDRVHTFEDGEPQPISFLDIPQSGIKEVIPIHEVSKLFYADTGKILNIGNDGEIHTPILLIKRDKDALPPQRPTDDMQDLGNTTEVSDRQDEPNEDQKPAQQVVGTPSRKTAISSQVSHQGLPQDLDQGWLAFESYVEVDDIDSEGVMTPEEVAIIRATEPELAEAFTTLDLHNTASKRASSSKSNLPPIKTSLSLLEVLLRLLSLQQFQQTSHLAVPDEILNFFLSEAATTGAASGDDVERRRIRNEARETLGFDPYDESPIKRRGEAYQYYSGTELSGNSLSGTIDDTNSPELRRLYINQPATPQHLLENRPHLSPRNTPDLPPLPKSASGSKSYRSSPSGNRPVVAATDRRGSLLVRGAREDSPLADK